MTALSFPVLTFDDFISENNSALTTVCEDYIYYYRGCKDCFWKYNLTPWIYRKKNIFKEDINFREMVLRSPNDFLNETTTLEKLVKMQHYNLPTRLLDITSNPLVALYFACQQHKKNKVNGIVYVFKIPQEEIKYYDSDKVSLISNLAKLSINKTKFKDDGFGFLRYEIREEKSYFLDGEKFDEEIKEDITKVFPVKVKLNNNRIVRQNGAFFIFGIKNLLSKKMPAIFPDIIIEKGIIIDESVKHNFLKTLDSLGINENTLFPELEHQANYLVK